MKFENGPRPLHLSQAAGELLPTQEALKEIYSLKKLRFL